MKVRAIMKPASELTLLSPSQTVQQAKETIESLGFLSLPVVENKKYCGFISTQYIYEKLFKTEMSKEAFLSQPVGNLLYQKTDTITTNDYVETAAEMFVKNKIRFIPVVENGKFLGIVTQNMISNILVKIYGVDRPKITLVTDNTKGILSKIADIILKCGGNITNIALYDTEVMGFQEISIRLEANDLDKVIEKLEDKGFQIKEFVRG